MSKYPPPDDADQRFFEKVMQGILRLNDHQNLPEKTQKKSKKIKSNDPSFLQNIDQNKTKESVILLEPNLLLDPSDSSLDANEKLFFRRPGLQHKVIKKLMRGEIYPADCLDLHGLTIEQARSALCDFLAKHYEQAHRSVLIIHGKGYSSPAGPKLKNHVNAWLMQIPWVLAFTSAPPRAGGSGAVYILLARRK